MCEAKKGAPHAHDLHLERWFPTAVVASPVVRARTMSAPSEQTRDDSLLNEIHSLAPYFSYDQGKSRKDDTAKNGTAAPDAPDTPATPPAPNWNDRMKAYVEC